MDLSSQNNEVSKLSFMDDADDFDFKPLSDGLGFHHQEKMKANNVPQATKAPVTKMNYSAGPVDFAPQSQFPNKRMAKSTYIQSDLALFYESKNPENEITTESHPVPASEAMKTIRLSAYVVDFALVGLVTFLTLAIVSTFTGIDFLEQLTELEEMSLISIGFIFFSYYFVYFTLLQKMQGKTLGMDLFGIKMNSRKDLGLVNIFFFELIVLLGFFSFGMTNFLNLPQSICGIKIKEKK